MKKILVILAFLLTGQISAQQKIYISPSAGILSMPDKQVRDMFYSELTVGYRVFRNTGVGLTGGYGSRSGSELFTLGAMITPGQFSAEKLYIETSLGGGIQKMKGYGMRGVFIADVKSGYYITPAFGIGIGFRTNLTKKQYTSTFSCLFLAFRF